MNFIELSQVDSTNNYAMHLLSGKHPAEGTVIYTPHQTNGKGQRNSIWESEQGKNITLSIILYPHFLPVRKQFLLSQAIAVGMHDFAKKFLDTSVKIKWPNDIYYENNKTAGLLIENIIKGNKFNAAIIGIGININQTTFLSEAPNPVSFKLITGMEYDIKPLITELCGFVEARYLQLKAGQNQKIKNDYLNALYRFGELHSFKTSGKIIQARISGITPEGKLFLETKNDKLYFDFKQVEFII